MFETQVTLNLHYTFKEDMSYNIFRRFLNASRWPNLNSSCKIRIRFERSALACVAVVSVSFKPSGSSARGHLAKRSKKRRRGGGEGRGRKGNACRWAQTFYRTPPNGFAPLGHTLSRQMSHDNQSFLTSGKSERQQNRGGQLVYFKL